MPQDRHGLTVTRVCLGPRRYVRQVSDSVEGLHLADRPALPSGSCAEVR